MEKINQYKDIIEKELQHLQSIKIANGPDLSRHLVINENRTEYVLIDVGWFNKRYISEIVFHIEIRNEKIWIHSDNTDIAIAELLAKEGIPKKEIVLGFLPKYVQELSEFAIG